ncbi:MAG: hypothetical protein IJA62_00695 [Ruminococcus sp.]|nr:hypothetical protein [Ruminococcus sp.]
MNRKRFLSAILAMLILLSVAVPSAMAAEQYGELYVAVGNVTDDGRVNVKDATAVQKHLAGIITLTGAQLLAADTNGDGTVNIKDATVIQKHIAGFSQVSQIGVVITLPEPTPDEETPETEVIPTCTGCDIPVPILPDVTQPVTTSPATTPQDPVELPSTPDTAQGDIYFNVECSLRVSDYEGRDTGGTVLYLINDLQELKDVLSTIKVTMYGDGTYTTPDVSPEYSEEFFKEYALVVSLNCVGGSNCSQEIDRLSVEGNVLTTHRTLYHPFIMLCDMNWQYVLVKVKAEDVESVELLADDTYIDECTQEDPTLPVATLPTDPTEPAETIPALTTEPETEPVSTLPTEPETEPVPTLSTEPAETQKPVDETTPVKPGYIPFDIIEEGRITDYKGSDETKVFYADSVEKALEAYAQIVLDPYYQGTYFLNPTLDEKYNEEYFEDKALIISLNCVGGSNCYQSINKLTVCDGVLTLHRNLYKPVIVTCDMNYQYVLIEVDKAHVGTVTGMENHNTYYTIEEEGIDVPW